MKIEQQNNAISVFENWLKQSKFADKQLDIDIEDIISYNDVEFVLIRFKPQKSDTYMLGLCGGYTLAETNNDGCVFSEFEIDNEETRKKLCEVAEKHSNKAKDKGEFQSLTTRIDILCNEKKYDEALSLIEQNIDKYKQPRLKSGNKCYQFINHFDFLVYTLKHKGEKFEWLLNSERVLLFKQLFILIEMRQFDKAERLIDEILSICPNDVPTLFERLEIFKMKQEYDNYEKALNSLHEYLWSNGGFARYLRARSWLSIEQGKYDDAVNLLGLTLIYDESDYSYKYANNEISYIKNKTGKEYSRPSYKELMDYFKNDNLVFPSSENMDIAYGLYDYCLRNKDSVHQNDIQAIQKNLIMLCRSPIAAKVVETNVLTPNRLIINREYGFTFEIAKEYKEVKKQDSNNDIIYVFSDNGKNEIEIRKSASFKTEEEYNSQVAGKKTYLKNNKFEIISEEKFVGQKIVAEKALLRSEKGKLFVSYWFKLNKSTIGRISAVVPEDHSIVEGDIITIISTWEIYD